jgi:hypothetical protein
MSTESTTTRAKLRLHGRGDPERLTRGVLPPSLVGLMASTPELERWQTIAERCAEQRARFAKTRHELEQAKTADMTAEREAAVSARPEGKLPKPKSPAVPGRLEDEQARLEHLDLELLDAARALLVASLPFLEDAAYAAAHARDEVDDEIDGLLLSLRAALTRQAEVAGEVAWIDSLVWDGIVFGWGALKHGGLPPTIGQALNNFTAEIEEQRARARARRAQVERDRAAQFAGPGQPRTTSSSSTGAERSTGAARTLAWSQATSTTGAASAGRASSRRRSGATTSGPTRTTTTSELR